ncbi:MAG: hypothetical protein AB8H79_06095 [Myxococcota bacterium]
MRIFIVIALSGCVRTGLGPIATLGPVTVEVQTAVPPRVHRSNPPIHTALLDVPHPRPARERVPIDLDVRAADRALQSGIARALPSPTLATAEGGVLDVRVRGHLEIEGGPVVRLVLRSRLRNVRGRTVFRDRWTCEVGSPFERDPQAAYERGAAWCGQRFGQRVR